MPKVFLQSDLKSEPSFTFQAKETGFKPNAVRPLSFGIIADPSTDLPHAYEEGLAIKKLLQGVVIQSE